MISKRKVVPSSTKQLISSTFGFEPPLSPIHEREEESQTLKNGKPNLSKDGTWEQLKRSLKRQSFFWIGSSIVAGTWLLVLTILYALHFQKAETIVKSTEKTIYVLGCSSDSECSSPKPYCDTTYTNECSQCISSTQCTDATKPVCDIYGSRRCHECVVDRDCATSFLCDSTETRTCVECFVRSDCKTTALPACYENKCVECETNLDCDSNPTNKICDLSTHTCASPCTSAICKARTDGKTKCCGTKCIEDCAAGTICDVFQSTCVPKITGNPRGTNVALETDPAMITTGCIHCHYTNIKLTGSMFRKTLLTLSIDYLTGVELIYESLTVPVNPNFINSIFYFQEAPNCVKGDFTTRPFLELGIYAAVTNQLIEFDNILPVTSPCFFVFTEAQFLQDIGCKASNRYQFQVVMDTGNNLLNIGHTPYYRLYGY